MGKTKILKNHGQSLQKQKTELRLEDFEGIERVDPLKELADPEQTAMAVFECLMNNDPDGAMEMISMYLNAINKTHLMKEKSLPKSTIYSALKHRNPTIRTLAKIMSAAGH